MEGVFAPKTPISTANRSKPRALFGIILTCLNREYVFLLPKVKKREYFDLAWAHWALKGIDSNDKRAQEAVQGRPGPPQGPGLYWDTGGQSLLKISDLVNYIETFLCSVLRCLLYCEPATLLSFLLEQLLVIP